MAATTGLSTSLGPVGQGNGGRARNRTGVKKSHGCHQYNLVSDPRSTAPFTPPIQLYCSSVRQRGRANT